MTQDVSLERGRSPSADDLMHSLYAFSSRLLLKLAKVTNWVERHYKLHTIIRFGSDGTRSSRCAMSSSQPFLTSSATSPSSRRRQRSRFTYKNLSALAHSATNCPLRVIAHIDLDAFYAQCETVRLGLDPSKPLAVQQWQGLIAINYPARAYGLNRHVPIAEAKEKCPEIICVHVATWKEGDTTWSYTDEAHKEIATRKVSLDPYRIESKKILALIKECQPKEYERVEKASIDEVFIDLSAQVHSILLERYPELRWPPPYDDPTEPLPRPHTTALDWAADALVDLDSTQSEEDDPDWDDICMLIGSEIVRDVRQTMGRKNSSFLRKILTDKMHALDTGSYLVRAPLHMLCRN